MNKTAIKNFAIWARNKLIADISYRAGLMGITADGIHPALPQSTGQTKFYDIGTAEPYAISGEAIHQREHLSDLIRRKAKDSNYQTAYKYIIEEVAYTWFNRLIAVRFMEVNDYLPSHIRVLSSDQGKIEPDLVTTPFDADLDFTRDEQQAIIDLKNGNKLDELFRLLFIKQCNALNEILPALFEKTNDYTELLLNLSVIDQDGVVYHLVHDIPEEDFDIKRGGQVEIIGWLYQHYNSEPKDETFSLLKKNVKITKERIPSATQLFTPDWIVHYMVENSLGRLWVDGHPDCELKASWKYYLEEAEQEPKVQTDMTKSRREYSNLNPEDIKVIDPCVGSGHILVYAFDVLMQIYESAGYSKQDAAKNILEKNLYGLDIDDRAFQMAYFSIMMKARQYNRRVLNGGFKPNVYSIQESNGINRDQLKFFGFGLRETQKKSALKQITGLLDSFNNAKEYGSILKIDRYDWDLLYRFVSSIETIGQMNLDSFGLEDTAELLRHLIEQGIILAQKYHIAMTNPPYMGTKGMNSKLSGYLKNEMPEAKADLYSAFIVRLEVFLLPAGYLSMITQRTWLYIGAFEDLRKRVLSNTTSISYVELGSGAFEDLAGEVVQSVLFTMRKGKLNSYHSSFLDLSDVEDKKNVFCLSEYKTIDVDKFEMIPNHTFAMKLSEKALDAFRAGRLISSIAIPKKGLISSDNNRFLKMWQEVAIENIQFGITSIQDQDNHKKWVPHNKGGSFRKWYGNHEYVINWKHDGKEVKDYAAELYGSYSRQIMNEKYYFKPSISWSSISSQKIGIRYYPNGFTFDTAGPSLFITSENERNQIFGLLASNVAEYYIRATNPTINLLASDISNLPLLSCSSNKKETINNLVQKCVLIAETDWNSFETSWKFQRHPLLKWRNSCKLEREASLQYGASIQSPVDYSFKKWAYECDERFDNLKASEEELNQIFIDLYDLKDELSPEVEDKYITVRRANYQRDIKSLLSYAVGCMLGRYSLDVDGLAYAGGDWNRNKYRSFIPDSDNIIPITDEEYLEDDIVSRLCTWLKVVFGDETLEDNLDSIANALGNKGTSSREIIRNYFLNDFFKDHCQTYSVSGSGKRPVYWLFDSGKLNSFKALIYLHRYNVDTIGNLRIDYLHHMQRIYEAEILRMQDMIDNSMNGREVVQATKRREKLVKQLKECREYDEKLAHLALSRIKLDLDDGVKVNYRKIQTANDGKFYEVLADSKNIMSKK